jgi:hypothetical protein
MIANAQAAPSSDYAVLARLPSDARPDETIVSTVRIADGIDIDVLMPKLREQAIAALAAGSMPLAQARDADIRVVRLPDARAQLDPIIDARDAAHDSPILLDKLLWEALKVQAGLRPIIFDSGEELVYRGVRIWQSGIELTNSP